MIVPVKHRVMPFDQGSNTEDWLGMSKSSNKNKNQHPEVNVCKEEKKCSKSVEKLTEDVVSDIPTQNSPVDTDALRNPMLDMATPLDGRRLKSKQDEKVKEEESACKIGGNERQLDEGLIYLS